MIKNFLDADEDDSLIEKKSFDQQPKNEKEFEDFAAPFSEIEKEETTTDVNLESKNAAPSADELEEMPRESDEAGNSEITPAANTGQTNEEAFWERKLEALKNENLQSNDSRPNSSQVFVEPPNETPILDSTVAGYSEPLTDKKNEPAISDRNAGRKNDYPIFSNSLYQAEDSEETIRKSGLAYAAAIVLFGSIVFTLVLGWFADLLLGTSPWGKVGGIILGAVIGFIQFFRTTSQILKNKD